MNLREKLFKTYCIYNLLISENSKMDVNCLATFSNVPHIDVSFCSLNSVHNQIQFTNEVESHNFLTFFDIVTKKLTMELKLAPVTKPDALSKGWPTFHLPCVNFLLYGFRCATISINFGASISFPCRVCLQKQRFVRGCKLRVITTRLQCATSNHAMHHLMAHAPQLGHPCTIPLKKLYIFPSL